MSSPAADTNFAGKFITSNATEPAAALVAPKACDFNSVFAACENANFPVLKAAAELNALSKT